MMNLNTNLSSIGTANESESLKRILQLLFDAIQDFIRSFSCEEKDLSIRHELVEYGKFASELITWCGKIPASRMRDSLYSFLKHFNRFYLRSLREGLIPQKQDEESLTSCLREIVLELGPSLIVSQDRMAAFLCLPSDFSSLITEQDLLEFVQRQGIQYGVDETAIRGIYQNRQFDQTVRIALGKSPILGVDAYLEDPLQLMNNSVPLSRKASSKVNYKDQILFVSVKEGQLILKKHPPAYGEKGMDIFGNEIESLTGLDVEMPRIENCECDPSGLQLISKVDGCAYFENGRIIVTPALSISGNVDFETGNIDTKVSVRIGKDVLSNFVVKTSMDVAVQGVIESAEIRAEGSVFCQGGINGKEKALVHAGKNVETAHINSAKVIAGGSVMVNGPVIQSEISARRVQATGNNGQIMGGCIHAWDDICATEIGSEMGIQTELVLGSELGELKKNVNIVSENLKTVKYQKYQTEQALKKMQSAGDSVRPQIEKLAKSLHRMKKELLDLHKRFDQSIRDLAYSENCVRMVRAEKTIHAGTLIRIMNHSMVIKKRRGPTSIIVSENRLVALPYRERSLNGDDIEDME